MFFKSYLFFIFLKFLWSGLFFGLVKLVIEKIVFLFKNNVYVYNLFSFAFWLVFGYQFIILCSTFYDFSFCWFGLLGMFFGLFLVKISLNFLFTNLGFLLYNKFVKLRLRKKKNEKHRANEGN